MEGELWRKVLLHLCSAGFGLGSWVCVNSVFTELPVLVEELPEEWTLPSYVAILVQIGNMGPIGYGLMMSDKTLDRLLIIFTLAVNTVSMILLAITWNYTTYLYGSYHSFWLYICLILMATMACTSSVLYIPYLSSYPEEILTSFMVGEGLSSLLPSVLTLAQGLGDGKKCDDENLTDTLKGLNFSTSVYFGLIALLSLLSLLSFIYLTKLILPVDLDSEEVTDCPRPLKHLSDRVLSYLLFILLLISAFANGALPSIQSYSSLPYGARAYFLSVSLSTIAAPAASWVSYYMKMTSLWVAVPCFIMSGLLSAWLFALALLSPSPPLQHEVLGVVLNVAAWVLCSTFIALSKMAVLRIFRHQGDTGLFSYGASTQIGGSMGSLLTFIFINMTTFFQAYDPCKKPT